MIIYLESIVIVLFVLIDMLNFYKNFSQYVSFFKWVASERKKIKKAVPIFTSERLSH